MITSAKNVIFVVLLAAVSISNGVNITHWNDPLTTTLANWTQINGSVSIVTNELCPANNTNTCVKLASTSTENASMTLHYYPDDNYYNWSISMDITSIPDRSNKYLLFQYVCYYQYPDNSVGDFEEGSEYFSNLTESHTIIFDMSWCDLGSTQSLLIAIALRIMERYDGSNKYSTGTFINNFEIKSLEFEPKSSEGGYGFDVSTCNGNVGSLSNGNVGSSPMNTISAEKFAEENEDFDVTGSANIEILIWTAIGYVIAIMAAFIVGICKSKNSTILFGVLFLLLQSGIDIIDVGSDIIAVGEIRNSKQKCGVTSCAMPDFQTFGTALLIFLIIGAILTLLEIIFCIYIIAVEYGCFNKNSQLMINEETNEMEAETVQKTEDELKMSAVYVIELVLTLIKLIAADIPNVITYSILYNESSNVYGLTLTEGVLISYGFTCIDITYVFLMLTFKHGFLNKKCDSRCLCGWTSLIFCCIWCIIAGVLAAVLGFTQADKHTLLLTYEDPSQTCYNFRADSDKKTAIHSELKVFEWNNTIIKFAVNYDVYQTDAITYDQYVFSFFDFRIYSADDTDNYEWIYCDINFNSTSNGNTFSKIYNYKRIREGDANDMGEWNVLWDTDYSMGRIIQSSTSYQMDNIDTSVMFQSDWPKGGCYSTIMSCADDFYPNCGATNFIVSNAKYDFCFDICSWD